MRRLGSLGSVVPPGGSSRPGPVLPVTSRVGRPRTKPPGPPALAVVLNAHPCPGSWALPSSSCPSSSSCPFSSSCPSPPPAPHTPHQDSPHPGAPRCPFPAEPSSPTDPTRGPRVRVEEEEEGGFCMGTPRAGRGMSLREEAVWTGEEMSPNLPPLPPPRALPAPAAEVNQGPMGLGWSRRSLQQH